MLQALFCNPKIVKAYLIHQKVKTNMPWHLELNTYHLYKVGGRELVAGNLRNKLAVSKIYCTFHCHYLNDFATVQNLGLTGRGFVDYSSVVAFSENCPWNSGYTRLFCMDIMYGMKCTVQTRENRASSLGPGVIVPPGRANHFSENC